MNQARNDMTPCVKFILNHAMDERTTLKEKPRNQTSCNNNLIRVSLYIKEQYYSLAFQYVHLGGGAEGPANGAETPNEPFLWRSSRANV